MNVHFTYKLSKSPEVENLINQQVKKLRTRLQVFKPDMISLHGSIDENPKIGYTASLNLRLPSGQMAVKNSAESPQSALRSVFVSLLEQLNKHKALLRSRHQWPRRRRVEQPRTISEIPFEQTLAAIHPDSISAVDIDEFVNANLDRLRRYVERELLIQSDNGQDGLRDVAVDEVVSEAIASALDEGAERPEKVAIEAWLFQLARRAIERIKREAAGDDRDVALQSNERKLNENTGDDDALRQFDFDGDTVNTSNSVRDGGATPEEIYANDEVVGMVETALRGASPADREAFILFTLEGFTIRELSAITERTEEDVRASIRSASEVLKRGMPVSDKLKSRMVERARTA